VPQYTVSANNTKQTPSAFVTAAALASRCDSLHLGQGLVLAIIQFLVSLSPLILSSHMFHILQVQGEWGVPPHLKQKVTPHTQSGSR
jgi:hypothetical protein